MAVENNNETPTLYDWYGKSYNFDLLEQELDGEVQEYINTLSRGEKDKEHFLKAYTNLKNGIKDGSIIFKDGRYIDTLGRYFNGLYHDDEGNQLTTKKKNKDYYGLMANYIYRKQKEQKEYVSPEDPNKIKWKGPESVSLAITKYIFNSNTWNNDAFFDLNDWDNQGKVKGEKDNRISKLSEAFLYVNDNFDNLFSGYTDKDKTDAIQYIKGAIDVLKDGKYKNDYLTLSKAASGLNYNIILGNKEVKPIEEEEQLKNEELLNDGETQKLDFLNWALTTYPIPSDIRSTPLSLVSNQTLGDWTKSTLLSGLSGLNNTQLTNLAKACLTEGIDVNNVDYIRNMFSRRIPQFNKRTLFAYILNELESRKGLTTPIDNSTFYIPGLTSRKRNTTWIYNKSNNTIQEISILDIPKFQNEIVKEYNNRNVPKNKQGGILKAYGGTVFDSILRSLNDDSNDSYLNTVNKSNLIGIKGATPTDYEGNYGEDLQLFKNDLRTKGYKLYIDENGDYKIQHISKSKSRPGSTEVNPIKEKEKVSVPYSYDRSSIIRLGRLLTNFRYNNKIKKIVDNSLNPALKSNELEIFSPVTGKFNYLQFSKNEGANFRLAPLRSPVSDPSLMLASLLEASKQAYNVERQGFLADDDEIKRTSEIGLKNQRYYAKDRADKYDFNVGSINQNIRDKAQLRATALKAEQASLDAYMQEALAKFDERKKLSDNFILSTEGNNIDRLYKEALAKINEPLLGWLKEHPNEDITLAGDIYTNFIKLKSELDTWREAKLHNVASRVYGFNYKSPYPLKSLYDITGKVIN